MTMMSDLERQGDILTGSFSVRCWDGRRRGVLTGFVYGWKENNRPRLHWLYLSFILSRDFPLRLYGFGKGLFPSSCTTSVTSGKCWRRWVFRRTRFHGSARAKSSSACLFWGHGTSAQYSPPTAR